MIATGAMWVNIPDTVGYTILRIRRTDPLPVFPSPTSEGDLSVHCHNDPAWRSPTPTAIRTGCSRSNAPSTGSVRAGNASLEIVMALKTRRDLLSKAGSISGDLCHEQQVTNLTGMIVQPLRHRRAERVPARVRIHQDGMLRSTCEIIQPEDVGIKSTLVMGKHSGRHALKQAAELGFRLSERTGKSLRASQEGGGQRRRFSTRT